MYACNLRAFSDKVFVVVYPNSPLMAHMIFTRELEAVLTSVCAGAAH